MAVCFVLAWLQISIPSLFASLRSLLDGWGPAVVAGPIRFEQAGSMLLLVLLMVACSLKKRCQLLLVADAAVCRILLWYHTFASAKGGDHRTGPFRPYPARGVLPLDPSGENVCIGYPPACTFSRASSRKLDGALGLGAHHPSAGSRSCVFRIRLSKEAYLGFNRMATELGLTQACLLLALVRGRDPYVMREMRERLKNLRGIIMELMAQKKNFRQLGEYFRDDPTLRDIASTASACHTAVKDYTTGLAYSDTVQRMKRPHKKSVELFGGSKGRWKFLRIKLTTKEAKEVKAFAGHHLAQKRHTGARGDEGASWGGFISLKVSCGAKADDAETACAQATRNLGGCLGMLKSLGRSVNEEAVRCNSKRTAIPESGMRLAGLAGRYRDLCKEITDNVAVYGPKEEPV